MEGMDIKSGEHEELRELCAASVSERLSPEEEERLSAHLVVCGDCRTRLGQYRAIEQFGLPMAACEDFKDEELAVVPREQEQHIFHFLESPSGRKRECSASGLARSLQPSRLFFVTLQESSSL